MKTLWIAAAACLCAAPAEAHHSFAMFDAARDVTVTGVVKAFEWTNPHIFVQVMAPGKDGALEEWSIEGASLNTAKRWGWKSDLIKPGDRVVAVIHPMRDGSRGGSMTRITLPNGTVLGEAPAAPAPK